MGLAAAGFAEAADAAGVAGLATAGGAAWGTDALAAPGASDGARGAACAWALLPPCNRKMETTRTS